MGSDKTRASRYYDTPSDDLEGLQERNALAQSAVDGPGFGIALLYAVGLGSLLWAGLALLAYWGWARVTLS
jgi:hypothetical protein